MEVRLVIRRGATTAQTIPLRHRETIVGRRKGCNLRIPSGKVSRRHCRLLWREGFLEVEDLASANGTLVDGKMIDRPHVLRPGTLLEVGPVRFRVEYDLTVEAEDRLERREIELATLPTFTESGSIPLEAIELEDEDEEVVAIPIEEDEGDTRDLAALEAGEDAPAEKPRKKKARKRAEEPASPDVSAVMRKHGPWKAPEGEDFRDLLSRIEEEGDSDR